MGYALIAVAAVAFGGLSLYAWKGSLGLVVIVLLLVSCGSFMVGRRKLGKAPRQSIDMIAKVLFTVVGCMALLRHPVDTNVVKVTAESTTLAYHFNGEPEPLTVNVLDLSD